MSVADVVWVMKKKGKGFWRKSARQWREYSDSWVGLGVVRGMFLVVVWDLILCQYL